MGLEVHYNVFGCFRDPRADVELARDAVAAGFEGVWVGDHFMPWIDSRPYTHHVLPWLGTLLSEVPDVPVGTSVTCPTFRYRPPVLAQAVATIDNMYPGRFNLGVGVGEALNEAPFVDGEFPDWAEGADRLVEAIEVMRRLWAAEEYVDGDAFFFIGRRLGAPVALEGALKLKEISYDHAEGFPAGELKHGPLALVTPETPVLAVLTEGAKATETLNNVKEVESRGAPVLGGASDAVPDAEKFVDEAFVVPALGELEPLVANVYFQLFSYHVANLKGRSIDKPRNLAKSVTVE